MKCRQQQTGSVPGEGGGGRRGAKCEKSAARAGEGSAGPAEPQPREDKEVRRWKSSAQGSLPPLMDLKLSFLRQS